MYLIKRPAARHVNGPYPAGRRSCPGPVTPRNLPALVAPPGPHPACTGGPGSIACPAHREPARRCRPRPGSRSSAIPPLPDRRPSRPSPPASAIHGILDSFSVDLGEVVARLPLAALAAIPHADHDVAAVPEKAPLVRHAAADGGLSGAGQQRQSERQTGKSVDHRVRLPRSRRLNRPVRRCTTRVPARRGARRPMWWRGPGRSCAAFRSGPATRGQPYLQFAEAGKRP